MKRFFVMFYLKFVFWIVFRYVIGLDVIEYFLFIYEYYLREVINLVYVIVDIIFKGFRMGIRVY